MSRALNAPYTHLKRNPNTSETHLKRNSNAPQTHLKRTSNTTQTRLKRTLNAFKRLSNKPQTHLNRISNASQTHLTPPPNHLFNHLSHHFPNHLSDQLPQCKVTIGESVAHSCILYIYRLFDLYLVSKEATGILMKPCCVAPSGSFKEDRRDGAVGRLGCWIPKVNTHAFKERIETDDKLSRWISYEEEDDFCQGQLDDVSEEAIMRRNKKTFVDLWRSDEKPRMDALEEWLRKYADGKA